MKSTRVKNSTSSNSHPWRPTATTILCLKSIEEALRRHNVVQVEARNQILQISRCLRKIVSLVSQIRSKSF